MNDIGEKILTRSKVERLGLNKVSVITADMLDGYTSIESYAFYRCSSLKSIVIPDSVTSIGERAFAYCYDLTSVTIGNSVTVIREGSFRDCYSLTSVDIPNGVKIIGEGVFEGCGRLTSVTIPNSVTNIGAYSFCGCTGLTSVTIHNTDTRIEDRAFWGCTGLTSVTIGDKTYEKQIITNGKCKAYKAFNADMTCRRFQYKEGETYELDGILKLCERGFHACLSLADVFNYYYGIIGNDVVVHEVELEGVSNEMCEHDSKIVARKITIGKRIL